MYSIPAHYMNLRLEKMSTDLQLLVKMLFVSVSCKYKCVRKYRPYGPFHKPRLVLETLRYACCMPSGQRAQRRVHHHHEGGSCTLYSCPMFGYYNQIPHQDLFCNRNPFPNSWQILYSSHLNTLWPIFLHISISLHAALGLALHRTPQWSFAWVIWDCCQRAPCSAH